MTNTNELGYQLPFCQLLLNEGFRTVHISKHNAFEQGKDIIAVDQHDTAHIYQLKGGNVTLKVWRDFIRAEVEELIDLSIVHPSVDKSKPFVPYLVLNGYLDDTVRLQIQDLNTNGKWKDNPLKVIVLGELLEKFLKWTYEFTPQEISNYKSFLELYFSEGREFIDDRKFATFLESVLRLNEDGLGKEERKRNISAAVLFSSYVATPFKDAGNHISVIQLLVLLVSHILAVAEKYNLKDRYWKQSFELVWNQVEDAANKLELEVREGFDSLYSSLWDGEIAPYRKQAAVTYVFAFRLTRILQNAADWNTVDVAEFRKLLEGLIVWGESAFLGQIFGYLYGRKLAEKGDTSPQVLLIQCLEILIIFNGRKSSYGLPSPYYPIETGLIINLGILEAEESKEDFVGRSFFLQTIIHLLVRAGRRDILEKHWREITYIQMERFVPEEKWMYFLIHSEKGTHATAFPKQTQSWKELQDEAGTISSNEIPSKLQENPFVIPFYLLAYPHRLNQHLVATLDMSIHAE